MKNRLLIILIFLFTFLLITGCPEDVPGDEKGTEDNSNKAALRFVNDFKFSVVEEGKISISFTGYMDLESGSVPIDFPFIVYSGDYNNQVFGDYVYFDPFKAKIMLHYEVTDRKISSDEISSYWWGSRDFVAGKKYKMVMTSAESNIFDLVEE